MQLQKYAIAALVFLAAIQVKAADSLAQWQGDITFMKSELVRIHPRFQPCGLSPEIDSAAKALSRQAASLSEAQMSVAMQRLLAMVHDGHTIMVPVGMKRGHLYRIPVMLWLFDDGLYVVDAADRAIVGRRVTRIGSLEISELLTRLEAYISRDNEQQLKWALPFYCTMTDFLVAAGAADSRERATLAFDDGTERPYAAAAADPSTLDIKLGPPRTGQSPDYLRQRDSMFYAKEERPGILYIAVNGMNDASGMTLSAFGKDLRTTLSSYTRAIVDLRLNNGGEASKADELLKTLIAFDVRGGRLAVLIGRMTFSAAQTFTTRIDQWTNAVFVGEPTGSSPNHYGNERSIKLPFSGIRINISSGLNQPVTGRDMRTAIVPEIPVKVNAHDHFTGSDPVLQAAVEALSLD